MIFFLTDVTAVMFFVTDVIDKNFFDGCCQRDVVFWRMLSMFCVFCYGHWCKLISSPNNFLVGDSITNQWFFQSIFCVARSQVFRGRAVHWCKQVRKLSDWKLLTLTAAVEKICLEPTCNSLVLSFLFAVREAWCNHIIFGFYLSMRLSPVCGSS